MNQNLNIFIIKEKMGVSILSELPCTAAGVCNDISILR